MHAMVVLNATPTCRSKPMPLSDHLTPTKPLGPENQSFVKDSHDAAELLDGAPPFLDALKDRATIILGRRGSGKSSVLHGHRALLQYGHAFGQFDDKVLDGPDLIVPFLNWVEFHLMASRVGRELSALLKDNEDPDFLFDATISDIWQFFIWESIFSNINHAHSEGELSNDEENSLGPVFEFFTLSSISSTDMSTVASQTLVMNAQSGLTNYLTTRNKVCHVLFDNLDRYPIRNPLIESVVSGFLRAVHDINENFPRIKIIVCIPEEIESYLQKYSTNIEKDFTATHRMRWRPIDLLQIVAYRYQRFMEIYDNEFYNSIKKLDTSKRKDVISLFNRILPPTVENSLGYQEPSLAYIIRHTQLIPRHFIILFNNILLKTHIHTGGFRSIDEKSIRAGVSEGEKYVGAQILKPFEEIYPKLLKSSHLLLGTLPAICDESDLDKIHGRFKDRVEDDILDIWGTLYEMGVIGMIDAEDIKQTPSGDGISGDGKYVYAKFHFNSDFTFSKSDRQHYCIHPIFSRYYGLVRSKGSNMMALYPKGIPTTWD
jgi:hypothetical protein